MIVARKETAREIGARNRARVAAEYERLARMGEPRTIRGLGARLGLDSKTVWTHLTALGLRSSGPFSPNSHAAVMARAATERLDRLAAQRNPVVEPNELTITEAAKRDYWAAWRNIRRRTA